MRTTERNSNSKKVFFGRPNRRIRIQHCIRFAGYGERLLGIVKGKHDKKVGDSFRKYT